MSVQDLRKVIEAEPNKLSIFADKARLVSYSITIGDLLELIKDFLTDEEKLKLFEFPELKDFTTANKGKIIDFISDESAKIQLLGNDDIVSGLSQYRVLELLNGISEGARAEFLKNRAFTDKIKLSSYQIMDFTQKLSSDEAKLEIADIYELDASRRVKIIKTCSDETKTGVVLSEDELFKIDKIDILSTFDTKALAEFLVKNKKFCEENRISPYEVIMSLEASKQKEFVGLLQELDLSLDEKRAILATLDEEAKEAIDKEILPEEFKTAISIKTQYGHVVVDLERNLEDYRGLDNLIAIAPEEFTEDQRKRLLELCDICPNMHVQNDINNILVPSNGREYKEAEEWIQSVIDSLSPEYSNIQKIAVIDNSIGKKVSYTPDYGTEMSNESDCRAIWRIISSGYGICNGVAALEKYMLGRVGIESELISSGSHAFLKVKDIELPLSNGEVVRGNTVLDPTWNLTSHRYGARPENFCVSYEEIRKHDIDDDKVDQMCHKNDEELQDATLGLDAQSLRQVFSSVGLTREDGLFPIQDLMDASSAIDDACVGNSEENINQQLALLARMHPEFATCQNSTISILSGNLLNRENIEFNRCVINKVYERSDKNRKPVVYIYLDSNEFGKKFYFADQAQGQFAQLSVEEFTKRFECYDVDLARNNGFRPWEEEITEKVNTDLSKTSGMVASEKGEER